MMQRSQQLHFVEPLPGFPDEDAYGLAAIDEHGVLYALRSVRDPSLRFVLSPAGVFFPSYAPRLSDALEPVLGHGDVDVFVVLTLGTGLADATANLRAPIAVAPATGRAVQVVLEDEALSMRAPVALS